MTNENINLCINVLTMNGIDPDSSAAYSVLTQPPYAWGTNVLIHTG